MKNARPRADGLGRGPFFRAQGESDAKDTRRIWNLRAAASGLDDAPVAFRWSLRKYSAASVESPSNVGLKFQVLSFGLCLSFVLRGLLAPSPRILMELWAAANPTSC